jgi:hypothetical protein
MKMPTDKENLMESPRNTYRLGATLAMVLLAGTLGAAELASPARRTVVYSTYLGGSADEENVAVAIDVAGNVYVAGDTVSADLPVLGPGSQGRLSHFPEFPHDIFLTKFDPSGSPLWSTYTGTEWDDHVTGMTLDPEGNPVLVGWVDVGEEIQVLTGGFRADGSSGGMSIPFSSPDIGRAYAVAAGPSGTFMVGISDRDFALPHAPGLHAIVVQIGSGTGARVAYFAGDCIAWPTGVAVDGAGFVYITGRTACADFPRVHAAQGTYGGGSNDAFVMKLNPVDFSVVYSTFLGGSADDAGNAIAVDSAGNAYVTGSTGSTDFPLHKPLQRAGGAFLTKLDPAGAIAYSTYLSVGGYSLAVDSKGAVFLPAPSGVVKIGPKGRRIVPWVSLDAPRGLLAINAARDLAAGGSAGPGFSTFHAFQPANRGGSDAFVTRIVDHKPKGAADPEDDD